MKESGSIYIERNKCENCYRCVRECGVKAINIVPDGVVVDQAKCIGCGACMSVCKPGVIKLRSDVHIARAGIKKHKVNVASVSPQWITEFEGVDARRFVGALKLLGFTYVSESALGAEVSAEAENEVLAAKGGVCVSSRCPAVADYILKHRPRLKPALMQVASPMVAHARMIKKWWGEDARVIHISACIAAKDEAERYPDLFPVALTFRELKRWMSDEGIRFEKIQGSDGHGFEPYEAAAGFNYPLCGAVKAGADAVTIAADTITGIKRVLDVAPLNSGRPVWLDLMACPEGCLGSNGSAAGKVSRINQRLSFVRFADGRRSAAGYGLPDISLAKAAYEPELVNAFVAESDTVSALESLGLALPARQTDCGACGFDTCRHFAKALSRGQVKRELCWQFVNVEAKYKFTALISRMSSGVAIVGAGMKIEEANRLIATMAGPEAELMYASDPGLRGVDAASVFPFAPVISSALENGDDTIVRDVQIKERIITVSVHTIQKYTSVLVICRNMLFSQVRNEEIVKRTQQVVRENLDTVQKIAYLLGENASRTEAILNSILNAQIRGDE